PSCAPCRCRGGCAAPVPTSGSARSVPAGGRALSRTRIPTRCPGAARRCRASSPPSGSRRRHASYSGLVIALLGNLSRDIIDGRPRPGGAPFHAARALRRLDVRAELYARCALEDREALVLPVARLGTPVRYVPGTST